MAKRKSKDEMQNMILQAAMDLLDKKSYQQVTMDEIAHKAGISKRTLYKYFPSKSLLFVTEFKKYFTDFRDAVINNDTNNNLPGMKMRQFMKNVFDFTKYRPAYFKLLLMYQANFFDNDLSEKEINDLHEFVLSITTSNRQFFDEYWNETVHTGYFFDKSNSFLFQMLIAMNKLIFIEYYYNRSSYDGNDPSLEEMLKTFSDMLYICSNYDMNEDIYNLKATALDSAEY